jgi:lysophospholipase L1-like esterase
MRLLRSCVLAIVVATALAGTGAAAQASDRDRFVGTWETAVQLPQSATGLTDQTERAMIHATIGGRAVRVRLSNVFGTGPVTFSDVAVAARAAGAAVVAGSSRRLTFGGRRAVTIGAGQQVVSDPVRFRVRPEEDLAISLAAKGSTGPATLHSLAVATSYVTAADTGDHAADVTGAAFTTTIASWLFVDGMDVVPTDESASIVAFGDSITDGFRSTFDANRRWPDDLARRLLARPEDPQLSVLNAGISGNRLLTDSPQFGVKALDRLDRDVLDQAGVRDVVVLLGINDIGQLPHQFDPNQIIGALRQIIARAHARHLKVFGATLLPFKNTTIANYYTPQGDVTRQAVNQWIRTSGAFDGVIDFDRTMRSAADPLMLNPAFDSGDHLHPNDAGYQAMADSIPLGLFRRS